MSFPTVASRAIVSIALALLFVGSSLMCVSSEPAADTVLALVGVSGPEDMALLSEMGADVLVEYEDMVLARVPSGVIGGLEASGLSVNVLEDPTVLKLDVIEFDTRDGEPSLPDGRTVSYGPSDVGYFMVQFVGPVKEEWRSEVEAVGGSVVSYLPNYAYIVRMTGSEASDAAGLDFVQWVGIYQPAYKVAPELRDWTGVVPVRIVMFEGEDEWPAVAGVLSLGGGVRFTGGVINRLAVVDVDVQDLDALARIPGVMWLEFYHDPATLVDQMPTQTAAWVIQTNTSNVRKLYAQGINGTGQVIGNADTGIVVTHWAFLDSSQSVRYADPNSAPNDPPNTNHRKVIHYWTFANNADGDWGNHGTHSAGVNAGNNIPNGGNGANNGIAFGAKISFEDVSVSLSPVYPSDMNILYQRVYNDSAYVHSGSMVCPQGGEYTTDAMQIDQFMHNNLDFLAVIANHNYGPNSNTVCDKASAKSSLSIGATENAPNQENMVVQGADYSGRGPTDDGRLKPTITTPTNVQSPGGTSTNDYASFGGTSAATPVAAGGVILIRDYFYQGFYPTGVATPSNGWNASGALMKAIAVNGADEMSGANAHTHPYGSSNLPYPTNDQGWGRMNLDNALFFFGDDRKLFVDDNATGISTGETINYMVSVVNTDQPLEVTLVWQDYWGALAAAKELVNNLDLEVTSPGGTVYKGNAFSTGSVHQSVTGGSFDNTNVEENFLLKVPETGVYTIKVKGTNVPQGPQTFALVATGNFTSMPDLRVDRNDIAFNSTAPVEGQSLLINVSAHVFGESGLMPVPTKLFIDDVETMSWTIDIMKKDNLFNHTWTAVAGNHTFRVVVDPANIMVEASETNNEANRTIYVNGVPKPVLEIAPTTIMTNEGVTANASKSTDDGNVASYLINWSDGSPLNWVSTPMQSHIYKENGIYNVTLRIKDNASFESPWTPAVTVTVLNRAPVPNLTAFPLTVETLVNISFDASKTKDPDGTFTLVWDFADGNTSANKTELHAYADDGEYGVTLTVTDNDGAVETAFVNVTVLNRVPVSKFGVTIEGWDPAIPVMEGNATTVFIFDGWYEDLDGYAAQYVWDFGDSNMSDVEDPTHKYGDDGLYEVSFYVVDDDGAMSEKRYYNITIVNLAPTAIITADELTVQTYEDIVFKDKSSDPDGWIDAWNWDMGDGAKLTSRNVTHNYTDDGDYTVTLGVVDDDGEGAIAYLVVKVVNRPPVAKGECNVTAYAGDTVMCYSNGTSDMDGVIVEYSWFHNETARAEGEQVSFVFDTPGDYDITLTVTDDDGETDIYGLKVNITARPVPPPDKKGTAIASVMPWLIIAVVAAIVLVLAIAIVAMTRGRGKRPEGVDKVAGMTPAYPDDVDNLIYGRTQGTSEYGPSIVSQSYDAPPPSPAPEQAPPVAVQPSPPPPEAVPEPSPPAEVVPEAKAEKAPEDAGKKEDIPTVEAKPVEKGPEG